ncbi:MAG: histidine phosphatase family protein [Rhodospirillaceae bacterium]
MNWPARLWIVRHGESAGNVAYTEAEAAGAARIAIPGRDVDVPLSERGARQASAVGAWFADQDANLQPQVILASPYARARNTAELIRAKLRPELRDKPLIFDERLRERELGLLDAFTVHGIRAMYPEQAERREVLGKFYYRPPSGESWCDVILRLRSALDTISLHYAGQRVLIVTHQMVVLCFRYLIENLDESTVLTIDRTADVANCAITEYEARQKGDGECLALTRYNFIDPLEHANAPITRAPSKGGLKA